VVHTHQRATSDLVQWMEARTSLQKEAQDYQEE
jgi:hypothetical protein